MIIKFTKTGEYSFTTQLAKEMLELAYRRKFILLVTDIFEE